MFESEKEQQNFLRKYNISQDRFNASGLSWITLAEIGYDFDTHRNEHEKTVQEYALAIQRCSSVHSLGYRVKDTEHLIEKIIRKNAKYIAQGNCITKDNYKKYITDLIGLRILMLFKEDWCDVHDFLMENYGTQVNEPPFVYIRKGDNRSFYEGKIQIKEEKPYRSAHYVIRHENGVCLEIQVRTLFEEAWSEVDHKIRYPYNLKNEMMNRYMEILNRATGMADEMGTFINSYIKSFEKISSDGLVTDNDVYNYIISRVNDCQDEALKEDIINKIQTAEDYKKMSALEETLREILSKL